MKDEKLGVGDGDLLEGEGIDICGGDSRIAATAPLSKSEESLVVVSGSASEVVGMRLMEAESTGSMMEMGSTWTIWVWRTLRGTGVGPTTCTTCWPGRSWMLGCSRDLPTTCLTLLRLCRPGLLLHLGRY